MLVTISDFMFFGWFDRQWKDQGRIDCHQILDPTLRTHHNNHYRNIHFFIDIIIINIIVINIIVQNLFRVV